MPTQHTPLCTAFLRHQRVAAGAYSAVAETLAGLDLTAGTFLVFDDATGAQVDYPWPGGHAPEQPADTSLDEELRAAPTVGRPKLGVVAREVTLLPRHWDWLGRQPGGASVELRKLVDEARRVHAGRDTVRAARESTYRFMTAIAGNLPGFEEATRALFAGEAQRFGNLIEPWPV